MMRTCTGYEAVVFDLDGTLYRGRTAIPGAVKALARLRRSERCLFLSNNGELQSDVLVERLQTLGFEASPGEVISSADLVLQHTRGYPAPARILALTSPHLAEALSAQGHHLVEDETAEIIVIGVDRELTRDRMSSGLQAALNGAIIVATNEDPTYPGESGLRPAAGAYVGFFRGMGFEPTFLCGKPDRKAVLSALRQWGIVEPANCLFVGDNLRTDIEGASRVGAESALVLTGVSNRKDVVASGARPSLVLESVAELRVEALMEQLDRPDSERRTVSNASAAKKGKT